MNDVPSRPQPLAAIMNMRRALINRKGVQLCIERGAVCVPPLHVPDHKGLCEDGFHANGAGYEYRANHIMDCWDHEPQTSPTVKQSV